MVEGPGCKLKGENLQKRICGQTVKSIQQHGTAAEKQPNRKCYRDVTNLTVEEVKTLGKELFIFFHGTDKCLRVHFLMNGSVCFNERTDVKKDIAVIVHLTTDVVIIYDSCVDVRSRIVCLDKYSSLHTVDICSPMFSYTQATDLINQCTAKMVCDVIMDQDVLPGVGNIIKNEALFNSGIRPTDCMDELSSQQVSRLLHRLRDFSAIFYKCRKEKSDLSRHYKIYGKTACVQCKGTVTVCKPGNLKRVTFFCASCQGNDARLPGVANGSLLAFVHQHHKDASCVWHCSACTLINNGSSSICKICLTPKRETSHDAYPSNVENVHDNTNRGSRTILKIETDGKNNPKTTIQFESVKRKSSDEGGNVSKTKRIEGDGSDQQLLPPMCQQHKLACQRKLVTKPGVNHGRPFFVCCLPRAKQCGFFKWGDEHHPRCHHDKLTVLRSVLKLNDNNGRQFYCCSAGKNKQCEFFKWL